MNADSIQYALETDWPVGAVDRAEQRHSDGFIFDNEKWAHEVGLAPLCIAKGGDDAEFAFRAGAYRNRQFWSAAGWAWHEGAGAERAGLLG